MCRANMKLMMSWLLAVLVCLSIAFAKNPGKPGAGGDGSVTTPRYQVIELPGDRYQVYDLTEASAAADVVWVAGIGDEVGYAAAMYSTVTSAGNLATAYLPEPRTSPNGRPGSDLYGDTFNRASQARAVTNHGDIAGACDFYDPGATEQEFSQSRATLWVNTTEGYELIDLGLADDAIHNISQANDVSDQHVVVGTSGFVDWGNNGYETPYSAVLWTPGQSPLDLNDLLSEGPPGCC